jgi:K+-transporting ATPase KdpF subunit
VDGHRVRSPLKGELMEMILTSVASLAIAIYLLYALLRPEKF